MRYGNALHWDILGIYSCIIEGLSKARSIFGPKFDGIGVDAWGVDYVMLDPDNRILGTPYHYRDDRTDGIVEEAFNVVPAESLYASTGIQVQQFNTLFQLLAERKSKLSLLDMADRFLLIPDFVNFVLSGVPTAEFTIASTTGLANPFRRDWDWESIEKFSFPRKLFSRMVEPGTILGPVTPAIAELTGLSTGTPVIATAGHDTASAVVSIPAAGGDDWTFLSCGTWSLLGKELQRPLLSSDARECNFTNEGGVNGTTRLLKNIIGLWPLQEYRRNLNRTPVKYDYATLTKLAVDDGPAGAWVNLNEQSFLKVGDMRSRIADRLERSGQTARSSIGFFVRVLLESLALEYRKSVRELERVTGARIGTIHAVGGGIQNEFLMQMTADSTGSTVIAGPIEGTAAGNVGVQALAVGAVTDLAEWRSIMARSSELRSYVPGDTRYFDDNYEAFLSVLKP